MDKRAALCCLWQTLMAAKVHPFQKRWGSRSSRPLLVGLRGQLQQRQLGTQRIKHFLKVLTKVGPIDCTCIHLMVSLHIQFQRTSFLVICREVLSVQTGQNFSLSVTQPEKGMCILLSLKDWKTKEQITNSEHSEMAPRFDASGNIVYTRKQNDAEDIFVHPGDANTSTCERSW